MTTRRFRFSVRQEMSPTPNSPEEKKLPDDELSHPEFDTENEQVASAEGSNAGSDNDDDDDEAGSQQYGTNDGYCLLPQDSNAVETNSDDEFDRFATLRLLSSTDEAQGTTPVKPVESPWTSKVESEPFPVDDEKANYIKTLMSSVELPAGNVPDWAEHCSESDWQEKLRERIACRQRTFFSNDNK